MKDSAASGPALVVLLALAACAAPGGEGGRDSLPPAPFATQAAASVAEAPLLLDAPTVSRVRGGTWSEQPAEESHSPVVTACDEAPVEAEAASGAVRALDGPAGVLVRSQVLSYPDEMQAVMAWKSVYLEVERCPEQRDSIDGAERLSRITFARRLPEPASQRAYATAVSRECDDCAWQTAHLSFAQVASRLVLVRLEGGELESLPALAEAAEQRVRCDSECGRQSAAPSPTPREWELAAAFLPAPAADAASRPGWTYAEPYEPDDAPLADPCHEGTVPLVDQVLQSGERALTSSDRLGLLVQEVYRYSSPDTAQEAHGAYVDRYRRCRERQDPGGSDGDTILSELMGPQDPPDGDRELVRRLPCRGGHDCAGDAATYVMVVRIENALTVVEYARPGEDQLAEAGRLMSAVHDHLRQVVGT